MFAVVQVHTEHHAPLAAITVDNKKEYCQRHGYKYIEISSQNDLDMSKGSVPCVSMNSHSIAVGWSKIKVMEKLLKEHQDVEWFFWIDTDALFVDFTQKLEDKVDDGSFFIVGRDCNGINVGTFFIKNCKKSLKFLQEVWETGPVTGKWWTETEQGQIDLHGLKKDYRVGFSVVSNKEFNSYLHDCDPGVMPCHKYEEGQGHFVVHLPGQSGKQEKLRGLLEKVIK